MIWFNIHEVYHMKFIYHRLSFILELLVNGAFIVLFFLLTRKQHSEVWKFIDLPLAQGITGILVYLVPFVILFTVIAHWLYYEDFEEFIRKSALSAVLICPFFIILGDQEFTFWLASIHLFSSVLSLYDFKEGSPTKAKKQSVNMGFYSTFKLAPSQLFLSTFLFLILIGGVLLSLPISNNPGNQATIVDHFFVATSAICVTGLSSVVISEVYSPLGQIILLLLVQVGGLGIMTLSSCFTVLMGRSLAMKEQVLMQGVLGVSSLEELIDMIVQIVKMTLIIELWGAAALTIIFMQDNIDFGEALFSGVFHAVSAFCNAGFSIYPNNMESFARNPWITAVICSLIFIGGIGFLVIQDFKNVVMNRRKLRNLSLHSKVVLVTSISLVLVGTVAILFGEFLNPASLDSFSLWDKIHISFFHSVVSRTAGFNTIPLGSFYSHTIFFMIILMFIGASPGSTGGGIKTSTFAILIQSVKATIKGEANVEIFGRNISSPLVLRATALSFVSLMIVSFFILLIVNVEKNQDFLALIFEVVSAFSTAGLSMGITSSLTDLGKIILICLMYIGRVGPLTLVLAIGEARKETDQVDYPDGNIMIG